MNLSLTLLVVVLPIVIFFITTFLRYPSVETGEDRKRAMDDFCSDAGLDFFFIGLSTAISVTIARYGISIPQEGLIGITIYSLFSAVVAKLYNMPWSEKRVNLCLLTGLVLGLVPITYALYVLIFLL